jgi:hypothetical protein
MSFNFFNRNAELIIGKSKQPGIKVAGLRITFDINKTRTSESNTCKITVDNLTKTTQNQIKADGDLMVELKVGYGDAPLLETIFVGDIVNVTHDNTKPGFVTTIEVEDGAKALRSKRLSCSLAPNATLRQALEKAVKELGLPEKTRMALVNIPNVIFPSGYAFEGHVSGMLDELCLDNGLEWSVQNNETKIYTKTGTDRSKIVHTVLIGSPRHILKKSKQNSPSDTENFVGWEFDTLLLPQAEPGGSILLSSIDVFPEIDLKVVDVVHKGDTHGNDWFTTIKGEVK